MRKMAPGGDTMHYASLGVAALCANAACADVHVLDSVQPRGLQIFRAAKPALTRHRDEINCLASNILDYII
jgi:hypothetical protein